MQFPLVFLSKTEKDTEAVALALSKFLTIGDIVILNGDLGTGKTNLVKHFAKIYHFNQVNSPTFSLVNVYDADIKIFHFDFYRIEEESELLDIGFNDYLNDDDSITFIEWGNLYSNLLPLNCYTIDIIFDVEFNREFKINKISK